MVCYFTLSAKLLSSGATGTHFRGHPSLQHRQNYSFLMLSVLITRASEGKGPNRFVVLRLLKAVTPWFPLALNIKGPWDPQSAKMGGPFQN